MGLAVPVTPAHLSWMMSREAGVGGERGRPWTGWPCIPQEVMVVPRALYFLSLWETMDQLHQLWMNSSRNTRTSWIIHRNASKPQAQSSVIPSSLEGSTEIADVNDEVIHNQNLAHALQTMSSLIWHGSWKVWNSYMIPLIHKYLLRFILSHYSFVSDNFLFLVVKLVKESWYKSLEGRRYLKNTQLKERWRTEHAVISSTVVRCYGGIIWVRNYSESFREEYICSI